MANNKQSLILRGAVITMMIVAGGGIAHGAASLEP